MGDAERFVEHVRAVLRDRGLSQRQLAEAVGRQTSTISDQLRGDNLTTASMARMAEGLSHLTGEPYTVESLLRGPLPVADDFDPARHRWYAVDAEGRAEPVDTVYLRDLGCVPCGDPLELASEPRRWYPLPSHFLARGQTADNTVVVRAQGDSMLGAGVTDGMPLLVRLDVEGRDGDAVLVNVSGDVDQVGAMIKRKRWDEPSHSWHLVGLYSDGTRRIPLRDGAVVEELGVVVGRVRLDPNV